MPSSPSDEEEMVYVNVKYELVDPSSDVDLEENMNSLIIPISISVTAGLVAPKFVDFGILTSSDSWAKLPVELHNPTDEYIKIDALSTSSGLNGETGLAPVTITSCGVFAPGSTQTVWVTWAGTNEGQVRSYRVALILSYIEFLLQILTPSLPSISFQPPFGSPHSLVAVGGLPRCEDQLLRPPLRQLKD